MSVSIVVPCYGSAPTLPVLVARLREVFAEADMAYEVILVVDGSPDQAWDVARELALRYPHTVRAIQLARNYGQHNAIIAGIRAARHETIVTMDDDLQHPPEQIPKLLSALTDDLDLVYGLPVREEHGPLRSLASRMVKAAMAGLIGVQNARLLSSFRVFRTFLRQAFDRVDGPHVSVDVVLSWATTRVGAVRVCMAERTTGRSGYTLRALVRHALNMLLGYSAAPLRVVTYLGLFTGLGGMILFGRVLWLYFTGVTNVAGFTTIASLIAIFSSAQMISLGLVGEYVGRIHARGIGRPTYVIRERAGGQSLNDLVDGTVPDLETEGGELRQIR